MGNKHQKGVFSIELVFVLLGLSACLYFFFDLSFQQMKKSQLERVTYSMVSVLKERSLFFQNTSGKRIQVVTKDDVAKIKKLSSRYLNVDDNRISIVVSSIIDNGSVNEIKMTSKNIPCTTKNKIERTMGAKFESNNKYAPIYQVTICQSIPAWYERVINRNSNVNSRILQAQSTFIGR